MVKYLLLIILFFFNSFLINTTHACQCSFGTFEEINISSDLIFRGIVINKKDSISIGKVFYTFKTNEIWKGQYLPQIIIETNFGGPACGESFVVNTEYIVYSFQNKTSRCVRNCLASTCSDIARLNYKYRKSYKPNIANDTLPLLSKFESEYFNFLFKYRSTYTDTSKHVEFSNKKIVFLDNKKLISKSEYFKLYGDKSPIIYFDKFSNFDKINNGYYGIVCINRKKTLSRQQKRHLLKLIQ